MFPILIIVALLVAPQRPAVPTSQDRSLRFTDAEIHESAPDQQGPSRAEFRPSGDFTATRQTIRRLIALAYDVRESQVVGVPDRLADARFDIIATAPASASAFDGPDLLRRLLMDRFGLVVHEERRKQSAYALARSGRKLGRRLVEATARCTPVPGTSVDVTRQPSRAVNECREGFGWNNSTLYIRQSRISVLEKLLEMELGVTVIDRTGLTRKYDADLLSPGIGPGGGPKPARREPDDPLFEAVREQLGLKLEPITIDLPVVRVVTVQSTK